jgi:hypothetical protein
MPAVSKAQQALMGQAYAIKTGKLKPEDLNPEYRDQIVDLAKSMEEDDLKDYAETPAKKLPNRIGEMKTHIPTFEQFINEAKSIDLKLSTNEYPSGTVARFRIESDSINLRKVVNLSNEPWSKKAKSFTDNEIGFESAGDRKLAMSAIQKSFDSGYNDVREFLNERFLTEAVLKMTGIGDQKPGSVDTKSIDELLKQIGPYMGYADWKSKIKNPDYEGILQKIAKHVCGVSILSTDRLVFESVNNDIIEFLNEGAILNAIKPSLEGDVKDAVGALEKLLQSTGAIIDYKHADKLSDCIIDIIDAAKQEARDEYSD